jgi:hypothetical protein
MVDQHSSALNSSSAGDSPSLTEIIEKFVMLNADLANAIESGIEVKVRQLAIVTDEAFEDLITYECVSANERKELSTFLLDHFLTKTTDGSKLALRVRDKIVSDLY